MKIPDNLKIKKKLWKIKNKWNLRLDGELLDGLCVFDTRTIYLRMEISKQEKFAALLHEIHHALIHELGLSNATLVEDLEEILVEEMAQLYLALFTLKFKTLS